MALNDRELKRLAGSAAFARGRGYYADGRVRLLKSGTIGYEAEAWGSRTYRLWLKREGERWRWGCACPAADDGSFCKHLVAAALAWRDGDAPLQPQEEDRLLGYLRAQPAERLARLLKQLADEDSEIEKRLRLMQAENDPSQFKKALSAVLSARGFLDYHRSLDYARRLDPVIAQLESRIAEDPEQAGEWIEYALRRLLKTYPRADDSAGAIGGCVAALAGLHARACALAPGNTIKLANSLYKLQAGDDWNFFPLADYWGALGEAGQARYGHLLAKELERLPNKPNAENRYDNGIYPIRRRAVGYARLTRDFDLAKRVLQWDIPQPGAYLDLIEACEYFQREREALSWAEQGARRHPDNPALLDALAECLAHAGLDEEALAQRWAAFTLRPDEEHWDRLKQAAGKQWPAWRKKAAASLREKPEGYRAGQLVHLLMHDGNLDSALREARARRIDPETLTRLAQRIESRDASAAGELLFRVAKLHAEHLDYRSYPAFAGTMQHVARLLPEDEWREWFNAFLMKHHRKTKLMSLLSAKGLRP